MEYQKYGSDDLYTYVKTSNSQNEEIQTFSFFENALYRSLRVTHMPHMLHWEDRNSMAHSVESRVPFLDHRMVEMSYHIPANLKIKNNIQKYILRESMRSIVPDVILDRKDKIGFGTPTDAWTTITLQKEIEEIFSSHEFLQRDFWNGKLIQKKYTQNPKGFGTHEVWRILNAELWYRHFTNSYKSA
jgi:asparagine synthase (glutamine-hydrolysing)